MPFLQMLLNLPLLFAGFAVKTVFFCKKRYGGTYLKGLYKGIRLCASEDGRNHKVRFQAAHLASYVRIQMELWRNIWYRFRG